MVAAVQEIERGYSQPFGPGPPCTFTCVIAMQAIDVADPPSRRQRLRGKQRVSQQVADSPSKSRRLSVKQSAPSLYPPPPPLVVLPLGTSLWNGLDEATFQDLTHRRRYRLIYNKFDWWWFCGDPVWVERDNSHCTEELWNLGRKDYVSLSKRQKHLIMQHFLHCTGAPPWAMQFAVQPPLHFRVRRAAPVLGAV